MPVLGFILAVMAGMILQMLVPWYVGVGILLIGQYLMNGPHSEKAERGNIVRNLEGVGLLFSLLGGAIIAAHIIFGLLLGGSGPGCDPVEMRGWLRYPC